MSSILAGFTYDIFISYRQKDNKGEKWVSEFVNALAAELESSFKEDISIYFDENPHEGLNETHLVEDSLKDKLKCLIFIPVISQTYCDPGSYAWSHELIPFLEMARNDRFGLKVKVSNGNVSSRVLPIRIHEIDSEDKRLLEDKLGPLRCVDFIFRSSGVNRPLLPSDNPEKNLNGVLYRDQLNKVANAIKEIISGLKAPHRGEIIAETPVHEPGKPANRSKLLGAVAILMLLIIVGYAAFQIAPRLASHSGTEEEKSVAVLPFENLSGDPAQQYFSDGIADEILNSLARLKNLKVPGRLSSFRFRGKDIDLKEVGAKLNVRTVLEGSVRKQGDRLRINAELINVEDGYQIWSQQFERSTSDILQIQKEIATAIVEELKGTMLQKESLNANESLSKNPEAYDAYLKGYYFWNLRKLAESEKYFRQAIALDSTFAAAYTGLAETYMLQPFFHVASTEAAMPKAEEYARIALRKDSMLVRPYITLAFKTFKYDLDFPKARTLFTKALKVNDNYAPAHYWFGQFLVYGEYNYEQALAEVKKAAELEPLGSIAYFNLSMGFNSNKKYTDALNAANIAISLNPANEYAYLNLGRAYEGLKQWKEAEEAFAKGASLNNDRCTAKLIELEARNGSVLEATKHYMELMSRAAKGTYVPHSCLALSAWAIGKKDEAHHHIRQALKSHDLWLAGIELDLISPEDTESLQMVSHFYDSLKIARSQAIK